MKRIILASALAITTATAGYAATEGQITEVQQYLPNYDVSTWSDPQIDQALNIITSTDSRSETTAKLESLAEGTEYVAAAPELTEAEVATLNEYVDGVDYSTIPQPTLDAALSVANSESSATDRAETIRELLMDDGMAVGDANTATSGEIALIRIHAPNVDVSTLTEPQVNTILSMIRSNDPNGLESEIEAVVAQ
ncbi:hypothetical protein ATO8_03016 [Roseivivax marinus]|jgi:hypothetical protein|uniref:Uncharacterized protein n=1 Tax=Roseivivax marinus TaxID=1379903 RepID=W4HM29_9RHOB|nr:hypothetical protein [Roseivivax marinus]ETW13827.1 hypothetical protein ATO8_03016 [Roseivivax marinus]SEK85872.1 hypothetical protein SAMN05444413_1046 [Roseivivax marinus]